MGYAQVKPQPADAGFKQVKPRRTHPPRPNSSSTLGDWIQQQAGPAQAGGAGAGFEQTDPPPDAGFQPVRDRDNPEARRYAKQRLMALVQRGVLPRYLPEWDRDPTAAWRAVSKMVFQPQQQQQPELHDTDWSGFGSPTGGMPELPSPALAAPTMGVPDMGGIDEQLKQIIGQALLKKRGTRSLPGVG